MFLRQRAVPSILAGALMALALTACNASTSHLDGLKAGTDKDISTPTTTFGNHDEIFASVQAANIASKVTVTFSLTAENVPGMKPNTPIPSLDKSFDVDQDASLSYHLTPTAKGWPDGTYKLSATMMDSGTQRDQKTLELTVGNAPPPAAGASNSSDNSGGATSSSDNSGATSSGN